MASFVISECGSRPLPRVFPKPRTGVNPTKARFLYTNKSLTDLKFHSINFSGDFSRERNWGLKVSAPLRVAPLDEDEREDRINGVNGIENKEAAAEFNPGVPPPFKLADIRAAIPKHCWVKNPWRSMSYVVRDVMVVFGLAAAAAYLNNWVVWPLYWAAQGTMFWALFVLGHDW